jgi:hypothetical protein
MSSNRDSSTSPILEEIIPISLPVVRFVVDDDVGCHGGCHKEAIKNAVLRRVFYYYGGCDLAEELTK